MRNLAKLQIPNQFIVQGGTLIIWLVLFIPVNAQHNKTKIVLMDGTAVSGRLGVLKDSSILLYDHPPYSISEISVIKIRDKMALWERPVVIGLTGGLIGYLVGRNNYTAYTGPGQYSLFGGYSTPDQINDNLQNQAGKKGFGIGLVTGAAVGFATAFITKKVKINGDLARYQKHNRRKLQKYLMN